MQGKFHLFLGLFLFSSLNFSSNLFAASADHLQNNANQQCLHAENNTSIVSRDCAYHEAKQSWIYNSSRQLVNANGSCLRSNSLNNSVRITTCNLQSSRIWTFEPANNRYVSALNRKCLEVLNGSLNGTVRVGTCSTNLKQQWKFMSPNPPAVNWLNHDFKLNGIGVGIMTDSKSLLYSLGSNFENAANYQAIVNFGLADNGYSFKIDGIAVANGSSFSFNNIKYGSSVPVQRYLNGTLIDTYTLIFTNLPVIQLNAAQIVDDPKLPGTFRLMSAKFNQDTGVQTMGIEFRGSTAQNYPKKPYSIKIGSPTDWASAQDVKLLDMRKDSDWILDAAYRDQSFVRNIVSHDIYSVLRPSAYIDSSNTPKGQSAIRGYLTEIIQNESYQGVYILEEKPDRKLYDLKKITVTKDANGIELWNLVDFSDPENGSVLYKADSGDTVFYDTLSLSTNFEQDYPKPENIVRWEPLEEFGNFVVNSTDSDFISGIGNRIDIDSLVDWWLLVELSGGGDNIKKNFYLARSGSGKFFMATWDHDATFGMDWEGQYSADSLNDPLTEWDLEENNLIKRLVQLPATGFNAKLKARWNALRPSVFDKDNLVNRFQAYENESTIGGAKARNLVRWPNSGGAGAGDSRLGTPIFIDEVLTSRLPILDSYINNLPE